MNNLNATYLTNKTKVNLFNWYPKVWYTVDHDLCYSQLLSLLILWKNVRVLSVAFCSLKRLLRSHLSLCVVLLHIKPPLPQVGVPRKGTALHFKSPMAERRHVLCVRVGGDQTHAAPLRKSEVYARLNQLGYGGHGVPRILRLIWLIPMSSIMGWMLCLTWMVLILIILICFVS